MDLQLWYKLWLGHAKTWISTQFPCTSVCMFCVILAEDKPSPQLWPLSDYLLLLPYIYVHLYFPQHPDSMIMGQCIRGDVTDVLLIYSSTSACNQVCSDWRTVICLWHHFMRNLILDFISFPPTPNNSFPNSLLPPKPDMWSEKLIILLTTDGTIIVLPGLWLWTAFMELPWASWLLFWSVDCHNLFDLCILCFELLLWFMIIISVLAFILLLLGHI